MEVPICSNFSWGLAGTGLFFPAGFSCSASGNAAPSVEAFPVGLALIGSLVVKVLYLLLPCGGGSVGWVWLWPLSWFSGSTNFPATEAVDNEGLSALHWVVFHRLPL